MAPHSRSQQSYLRVLASLSHFSGLKVLQYDGSEYQSVIGSFSGNWVVKFGSKFSLQLITTRNIKIQEADRKENLILNTNWHKLSYTSSIFCVGDPPDLIS
jgi:hypothetical protein